MEAPRPNCPHAPVQPTLFPIPNRSAPAVEPARRSGSKREVGSTKTRRGSPATERTSTPAAKRTSSAGTQRCFSWAGLEELRPDVRAALARHACRSSELDDVVQESLIRAARYRGSLGDTARLRGWVIRIALNVMRDHMRRDLRLPRVETADELFESTEGREAIPGDDSDEEPVEAEGIVFEREFLLRHLDRALAELPRTDRRLLSAWYADDDDRRRASHVRESAPELAKVRAFRARSRLTRLLRRRLSLDAPEVALEIAGDEARRGARCTPGQEKKKERGGYRRARS